MKTILTTSLALSLLASVALAKGPEGGMKKESSKIKSKKEKTHQYEQQYKGTSQQNKAQQQNRDKESLEKGKKDNITDNEAQ